LEDVARAGRGKINLTIGSALDIFGGSLRYDDVVALDRKLEKERELK
jgi:phosphoribosylformimino-5-aminoimidazole carboxamide ribotide isomerase